MILPNEVKSSIDTSNVFKIFIINYIFLNDVPNEVKCVLDLNHSLLMFVLFLMI